MCSALSQSAFGVEGFFGRGKQVPPLCFAQGRNDNSGSCGFFEFTTAFERLMPSSEKRVDQFLAAHLLAVVFWRPAQQAEKINEGFG